MKKLIPFSTLRDRLLTIFSVLYILYIISLSSRPRENFICYVLYTVIPYGVSIVYTAINFFFPQVRWITKIGGILLHPINFILNLVAKIDHRAEPIRRTVEALHRSRNGTASKMSLAEEKLNNERFQCRICQLEEKRVLLRPCNHLCYCERCSKAIQRQQVSRCPICDSFVNSYETIFIS
ncbi:unnamed protein product [Caenorhabditis bovis]|uniref:RING-type domain-containing protein n=1 Tax=Caenorhabditis bovis TaxID=2654633 RepID=A0A8S1E944_9PELO|nr:unnamed protein product [Caenorhabditis bovis]